MNNSKFAPRPPPLSFYASHPPLEPLEPRTFLAASLFEDVNKDPLPIIPSPGLRLDDHLVFPMHTLDRGTELWTADGTATGTKLLKDIRPGPNGSDPRNLTRLRDAILFSASNGKSTALWRTDGTRDGTRRIRSLPNEIDDVTVVAGHLYFTTGQADKPSLWRSDGTKKGTQRLLARGEQRSISLPFLYKRHVRFVVHSDESDRGAVWTIDESDPAKPRAARTLYPRHAILDPHVANGWIYHATDAGALARTNLKKTEIIKDLNGAPVEYAHVDFLRTIDDTTFFLADDGDHGRELWRTDGTPDGTFMLRDIAPGDDDAFSFDTTHVRLGDSLFFIALNSSNATVWKSDGTTAGTVELRPGLSPARELTRRGDHIYFWARQLGGDFDDYYKSDGTSDGTRQINPPQTHGLARVGSINGDSIHLGPGSGSLHAYDKANDEDPTLLYRSKRTRNANPHDLTTADDDLYFATAFNDESSNLYDPTDFAIWKKTGNHPAQRLATLPGRVAGIYPVADNRVFFTVFETDAVAGSSHHIPHGKSHLWITDGTPTGTRQFTPDDSPLTTGVGPAWPDRVALVGDVLYYYLTDLNTTSGDDEGTGALWRSDGTTAGTGKVIDAKILMLAPAPDGRRAYFISDTQDVWLTDGDSTERLVRLDADDVAVEHLIPAGDGVYFTTIDRDPNSPTGRTLWFAHETGNARKLAELDLPNGGSRAFHTAHANGRLFFAYRTASGNAVLWTSDATPTGTRMIRKLSRGAIAVSTITDVVALGDHAYFVADTSEQGAELWRSDGTREGTVIVNDLDPGPRGSYPMNLTSFGGRLVFFAHDEQGRKLVWSIDGLGADPVLLGTLPPQSADDPLTSVHYHTELIFHGNRLIAAYPHPRYGHELWRVDL